jgi:hypothetical protein
LSNKYPIAVLNSGAWIWANQDVKVSEANVTKLEDKKAELTNINNEVSSLSKDIKAAHDRTLTWTEMSDFARKYEKGDPGSTGVGLGTSMSAARNEADSVTKSKKREVLEKKKNSIIRTVNN